MSVDRYVTDVNFKIKEEHFTDCLIAIAKAKNTPELDYRLSIESFYNATANQKAGAIMTCLANANILTGFDTQTNEIYVKDCMWFNRDFMEYRKELNLLDAIAPYVENGSYIQFSCEDEPYQRLVIHGSHCYEVKPNIVWPEFGTIDKSLADTKNTMVDELVHSLEILDYDTSMFTENELETLADLFFSALAQNDEYSSIYNETLENVVDQYLRDKETSLDNLIDNIDISAHNSAKKTKDVEIEREGR